MMNNRPGLMFFAAASLAFACSDTESQQQSVSETTIESQMGWSQEQAQVMEADSGRSTGGLTANQYDQAKAVLIASGLTEAQAEAMIAMGEGGTPGGMEQLQQLAAMDPRARAGEQRAEAKAAAMKESGVMVRYDGVDYPMQYVNSSGCGDFFGFTSINFVARTSPGEESGPTLAFTGGQTYRTYRFSFWLDYDANKRFSPDYAAAIVTLKEQNGGFVAIDGMEGAAERDLGSNEQFVVEDSRLYYEGPVAGSGKTISIEAVYCPT